MQVDDFRRILAQHGQGHVLAFWDRLDESRRAALLDDLRQIDFELLSRLIETHVRAAQTADAPSDLQPPTMLPVDPTTDEQRRLYAEARQRGAELVAAGKVAALVVAGGQGTRLGFDGPKGMFPISPVRNQTLFGLFAESLLAASRRFGRPVPWYVMTSPGNDRATREYFAAQAHFGLDADDVFFFQQGVMPAVDFEGRILLAEEHRVALSPDGHGGTLRALAATGALADMRRRGVETISYFQVDNPLVRPVDPLFVGLHAMTGSRMSSLTIGKASDDEKVGVFAESGGRLRVIEYSDLPTELATARNPDGSRRFDAANIAVHVLERGFVEALTGCASEPAKRDPSRARKEAVTSPHRGTAGGALDTSVKGGARPTGSDGAAMSLPWHRAAKAVACVDPITGQRISPARPNAIKFETFIFDALPLAEKTLLLQAHRGQVFSPVKNATGTDSPATARRDLVRRAAEWLERCGVAVPRTPAGEPDCTLEISPLLGEDAEELAAHLPARLTVPLGGRVYLTPQA